MTDERRRLSKLSKDEKTATVVDQTKVKYVEKIVFESVIRTVVTIMIQDLIILIF